MTATVRILLTAVLGLITITPTVLTQSSTGTAASSNT